MGETAEDAVKREVLEETGVEYEIDHLAVIHEKVSVVSETAVSYIPDDKSGICSGLDTGVYPGISGFDSQGFGVGGLIFSCGQIDDQKSI